jgi:tetratricopeptide (TPR) repeat protein
MPHTANREAFLLYIAAERQFSVVSEQDMAECRAKFAKVTGMDPAFARAWGWRSYAEVRSVLRGWLPESAMQQAGDWAAEAVKLAPYDYATHWDQAFWFLNKRRFDEALKSYERGIHLYDNETDLLDRKPGILAEAAEGYIHAGQPARAVELLTRAMKVPDWYRWNLGFAYYQAQLPEAALEMLQSMQAKPGDWSYVPDAELFVVIATYRKAQMQLAAKDQAGHDQLLQNAKNKLKDFRKNHPDYKLEDCLAHRSRFQNKADEAYWFEPLRELWGGGE